MPSPTLRQIPRSKLYEVFKSEELVRLVEDILYAINNTLPGAADTVQDNLDAHIADAGDAHPASAIGAAPGGSRVSNTVQGQLGDLDTAKLAAAAVSVFILTLLDDADAGTARGTLGLGSMATQNASNVAITGGTIGLGSGSLGYAAGNGGTVTQPASKGTNIALSELSGEITMNAAALAAGAIVTFTLTNSTAAATDTVIRNHVAGGTIGAYSIEAVAGAGQINFYVRNNTAGSLSEAIVIRFAVFKAATT